jgi:membrane fusion protein, multidrug efflux system
MIPERVFHLFLWSALLAISPQGYGQGKPPTPSGPLSAETYVVQNVPFAHTVSTVGTLKANESVSIVPELSRRLVKIHFEEGAPVAAGDLLFKLDDSDLVAELAEIDARMQLAKSNKARAENLRPSESISQQEYEAVAAQLSILEAQRNTKATEIAKTEIRAPFAGRAGIRQVSEGAFVSPATPLIQLQDVSRIKVDFPLPERYAGDVKIGQKFNFTVAGNGTIFQGIVSVIEPAIDASTRSLQIRGLCSDPKGLLPGGFAEVTLTLDGTAQGFVIPSQAIVPSPRGQGVYLIETGKAKLQPVEVGIRTEDKVQILRGLKQGDVIATTNLLRIRPGLEVNPTQP